MTREVDLPEGTAKCTYCREWKDLDQFGRRSGDVFGFSPRCKECVTTIHAAYKARRQGLLSLAHTEGDPSAPYVPERWGPPTEDVTDADLAALNGDDTD